MFSILLGIVLSIILIVGGGTVVYQMNRVRVSSGGGRRKLGYGSFVGLIVGSLLLANLIKDNLY